MSVRRRGILPWRPCLILDASVPLKSFLAHGFFRQVTLALRLTDLYILTPFSPTTSLRTRGCCSKLKNSPLLGFHHRATRARCLPDARLCFTQLHNRARSPRSSSLLASFACARLFCLCERNLLAQHSTAQHSTTSFGTAQPFLTLLRALPSIEISHHRLPNASSVCNIGRPRTKGR